MPTIARQTRPDGRPPTLACLDAGCRFAGYRIERRIGCGGMATVYLARERGLDRDVALKLLHVDAEATAARERFAREAQISAQLEHPAILPVYRFGVHGRTPWMALRYADGGDLRDLLRDGSTSRVLRALADVAAALGHAHAQGIVHRDLKPANVLLDRRGAAYLADFGVAKLLHAANASTGGGMTGTPTYMSPEQALDLPVSPRTDVYALGVICFEWLTGDVPFRAATPPALLLKQVEAPLPAEALARLPPVVAAVLSRALHKRPARRHATPTELVDALSAALSRSGTPRLRQRTASASGMEETVRGALRTALACALGLAGTAAW